MLDIPNRPASDSQKVPLVGSLEGEQLLIFVAAEKFARPYESRVIACFPPNLACAPIFYFGVEVAKGCTPLYWYFWDWQEFEPIFKFA